MCAGICNKKYMHVIRTNGENRAIGKLKKKKKNYVKNYTALIEVSGDWGLLSPHQTSYSCQVQHVINYSFVLNC